MTLTLCTITGGANGWVAADGTPATGAVTFQPVRSVAGSGYIVAGASVSVRLVAGNIAESLTSTTSVPTLQYLVTEQIADSPATSYVITPTGTALDLSSAPRGAVGLSTPLYVLASTVGAAGGVAPLDSGALVPLANLPASVTAPRLSSAFSAPSIQLVACTGDPSIMPGSPSITSGRPYFHRAYVDQAVAATKMTVDLLSTGASTVASNVFLGVYSLGGVLLAQTADLSASFPASSPGAIINAALTSTLAALPINTEIYLAFLGTFTGTAPTLVGGRQFGTNQTMTSDARLYTNSSGSTLSALPANLPTLAQTAGFVQLFIGLGP